MNHILFQITVVKIYYPNGMDSLVPDFKYILGDVSRYSNEEINGGAMLRVALLLMKYKFRGDLIEHLRYILMLLKNFSGKRAGMEYIETILRYLINEAPKDAIT